MTELDEQMNHETGETASKAPPMSIFRKIISNITIEPVIICWLLPFLLTYSAIENLNIEKACRGFVPDDASFGKDICKVFVRKDNFDINCEGANATAIDAIKIEDLKKKYPDIYKSIENNIGSAMNFLCATEEKVQTKLSNINAIRNPIAAIGPLIIILFAGPWSDKKNLRVPCMIVPLLGEAIGYFCKTVSSNGFSKVVLIAFEYQVCSSPRFSSMDRLNFQRTHTDCSRLCLVLRIWWWWRSSVTWVRYRQKRIERSDLGCFKS